MLSEHLDSLDFSCSPQVPRWSKQADLPAPTQFRSQLNGFFQEAFPDSHPHETSCLGDQGSIICHLNYVKLSTSSEVTIPSLFLSLVDTQRSPRKQWLPE